MEELTIGIMPKTPEAKRISIIRDLRRHIDNLMEDYERAMGDFAECGLGNERECIESCLGDLWKHEEMLNELIRNSSPKIKEAQDKGRWEKESDDSKTENTSEEVASNTEDKLKKVTCPDCGWEWEETDICPECWYEF